MSSLHTIVLQCLLLSITSVKYGSANIMFHDGRIKWAHDTLDYLKDLWEDEKTPVHKAYARCDYDGCQCCGRFYGKHVCLEFATSKDQMNQPGIVATTKIMGLVAHQTTLIGREKPFINFNADSHIKDAQIAYRLYDYCVQDLDVLTVSVKLLIRIGNVPDYVCSIGTFTIFVPDAYDLFIRPFEPEERCIEMACGQPSYSYSYNDLNIAKIMDGELAEPGEFPWLVKLNYNNDSHYISCCGTLINCQWFITAAHCVYGATEMVYPKVILGKVNLDTNYPRGKVRTISYIGLLPDFDYSNNILKNIALVKMNKPVEFDNYVRPICLPSSYTNYQDENCLTAGWGSSKTYEKFSRSLMKGNGLVLSDEACKNDTKVKDALCTFTIKGRPALGDSGAPLQCRMKEGYVLAGIFYDHQVSDHNIFYRVDNHLKWIQQTIEKFTCIEC